MLVWSAIEPLPVHRASGLPLGETRVWEPSFIGEEPFIHEVLPLFSIWIWA